MLGTRTGWSYREIMELPRAQFQLFVDTLTQKPDDD